MPNWVHNYMKATGAADEIARFKATCIVDNSDYGNADDPGPRLDFNAIIPMPEVLRGSELSSAIDGLLMLGRDDLVGKWHSLTGMLDYPWVKKAGVTTIEGLKALLIERDPEVIAKAQRTIAIHEQTGFLDQRDWSNANWGATFVCRFYLSRDEADCLECGFDTAWSPPVPFWEKMGTMFPAIEFELSGSEPINDFAIRGTIRDGRMELHEEPLVWTTIDPKTGEEVSGTREEIDNVLGDLGGMVVTSMKKDEEPSDGLPF